MMTDINSLTKLIFLEVCREDLGAVLDCFALRFAALLHESLTKHLQLHPTLLSKKGGVHPNSTNLVEQENRCSRNWIFKSPHELVNNYPPLVNEK
jgi:hypothetical protein